MRKFDLRGVKGVFSNLRGNERPSSKADVEVQESLQSHDFFCGKVIFLLLLKDLFLFLKTVFLQNDIHCSLCYNKTVQGQCATTCTNISHYIID